MPELVTIPNVPLVETGVDWPASTGPVTFTADHLISAAEAPFNDPAIKLPRLRFGHLAGAITVDDSAGGFREQPCVGKFTNLRVEQEGNLLVADLVGVPRWLAEVLPTAYPSRSVEAFFEVQTSTGKKHRMVIASVALLGESLPGVQTLDDLEYLFSDEPTEWIDALTSVKARVAASQQPSSGTQPGGDRMPQRVAASVDTGDVRSAFYEQVAVEDRYWWWLHQMYLDPAVCIAEDDSMEYWLVPYSVNGQAIEFEEPVQVRIQWVEKDSGDVRASVGTLPQQFGQPGETWVSANASRPAVRQAEWDKQNKEANAAMAIDIPALRAALEISETDLPDDATEEQINQALAAHSSGGEGDEEGGNGTEEKPGSGESGSEGGQVTEEGGEEEEAGGQAAAAAASNVVQVDREVWEATRAGAQAGLTLQAERRREDNAAFLDAALRKGKISPATRASYLAQMNGPKNDGEGPAKADIKKLIEGLPEGVVPIEEIGHGEGESTQASSQGTGLFPDLDARRAERAQAQEA